MLEPGCVQAIANFVTSMQQVRAYSPGLIHVAVDSIFGCTVRVPISLEGLIAPHHTNLSVARAGELTA